MIKRTLGQIAAMVDGEAVQNDRWDAEKEIHGVSIDSRQIATGNLFVPIIGSRTDGHLYVSASGEQGAAAALWQRDRGQPPEQLAIIVVDDTTVALQRLASAYRKQLDARIVAVTGSNGKTTTKDLIAAILSTRYKVHKTIGNYNSEFGLPLTMLDMDEHTEIAVLEMGMRGRGEIALLSQIAEPDAAVVTNVGDAHLEQLGSREEIARAKLEIVTGMKAGSWLAFDGDEPLIDQALAEYRREGQIPEPIELVRFGNSPTNDVYPTRIEMDSANDAVHFAFNIYGADRTLTMPLLGRHNVMNASAAAAVGRHFGIEEEAYAEAIRTVRITGMRTEIVRVPQGPTILNDTFNSSPTALKAALDTLIGLEGYERKFAVIGDMLELGAQEEELHAAIGAMLDPQHIDFVFTYGPLARYTADSAASRYGKQAVRSFTSKAELVDALRQTAGVRDVVLVKASRGMKMEEVVYAWIEEAGNTS